MRDPDLILFGGGRFFVVWDDRRDDLDGDIFAARVTATGAGVTVLDPAGIAASTAAVMKGSQRAAPRSPIEI